MLQVRTEALANRGKAFADVIPIEQREPVAPGQAQTFLTGGLIASLAGLSFVAVCITAAFFILTPRTEAGLLGRSDTGPSTTGVDEEVDLNSGGRITENPEPVMRIRFPDEPGGQFAGPKYWRMMPLESYAGGMWTRGALFPRLTKDALREVDFLNTSDSTVVRGDLPAPPSSENRIVRQEIFFDDSESEVLPVLDVAKRVTAPNAVLDWDSRNDMTVVAVKKKTPSLSYEAISEVRTFTPEELRGARMDYPEALGSNNYGAWSAHSLAPRTRNLARDIVGDANTVYDAAVAIDQWLSGSDFAYTLNVPDMGNEPIEQFLHDQRRGHCEMFASAMALMLRSQGIPARVVQGYRGGEWNEADESYIVRKSMAHLWVEVYFIDYGWIVFDPSPARSETDELAISSISRWWSSLVLRARMRWYSDVVNFQGGLQVQQLRSIALGLVRFDFDPLVNTIRMRGRIAQGVMGDILIWTLGILGIALGYGSLVRIRRRIPRKKEALTVHQRQATRLYRGLRARLAKLGTECEGMTAREVAQAVRKRGDLDAELVDRVIALYDRVRFGEWEIDGAQIAELQKRVKALKPA
jgi:transglutaminase-like putative cysteine protease